MKNKIMFSKLIMSSYYRGMLSIISFSFMIASCNNNDIEKPNNESKKGELAIEIFSHVQTLNKTEYINEFEHEDFLSAELISMISSNKQAKRQLKRISDNEVDTVFSLEEIPIYSEQITKTRIYSSGVMESELSDITPEDKNPINSFMANPLPEESKIRKTIIVDGMINSYSSNGDLVYSVPYAEQNMKQFLDTLKYYVSLSVDTLKNSQISLKRRIKSIEDQKVAQGIAVRELSNGNIVLEQYMDGKERLSSQRVSIMGSSERLKSRTELNPDMTKTISFELLQGNQLLERRRYTYSSNKLLRNSKSVQNLHSENPENIKTEVLILSKDGFPMIKTIQEHYLQNQILFHF